jgi:flagellin
MSITVNTNTQSLFAQRALSGNTFNMQKSIEKLSTGFRINRAADDAAGLSISEKLTAQIRGLEKANQNIGDGISLVQTAEGGLSVIQDNLQRIRELVVQGANGTNGGKEADAIQREINERVKAIDDIAKNTKYNGLSILRGGADYTIQSGADNGQTTTLSLRANQAANTGIDIDMTATYSGTAADNHGQIYEGITTANFALHAIHLGATGQTVDSAGRTASTGVANVTVTLAHMDTMIDNLSRMRSYLGAAQNSLESKAEYVNVAMENASASRSRVRDVDVAKESSVMIRNQILQQSSAAMLSQANQTPQLALNLLP